MNNKELISKLLKDEDNNFNNYDNNLEYAIVKGIKPIIISSPHCCNHFRNNKMKNMEIFTGSISKYLQSITNCHLIYSQNIIDKDPNYDNERDSQYKQKLKQYIIDNNIELLIDFHGFTGNYSHLIEIGTIDINYKSLYYNNDLVDIINNSFTNIGRENIIFNDRYKASKPYTIANFIYNNTNSMTFQMEVHSKLRNLYNENNYDKVIDFICCFEEMINNMYEYLVKDNKTI